MTPLDDIRLVPAPKDVEMDALSATVMANPRDIKARYSLASLLELRRDYRKAIQHYGVLMILDPANRSKYETAGKRCLDFEAHDKAEFEKLGGIR